MVVTHRNSGDQLCIGLEVIALPNLRSSLDSAEVSSGDFVIGPLVHPRYERESSYGSKRSSSRHDSDKEGRENGHPPTIFRKDPFTRSDLELKSSEWSTGFIGKLSPWIRCDADSARLRTMSEDALMQEVAFANHLSLRAVLTPPLTAGRNNANFARAIYSALTLNSSTQVWVRLPLSSIPTAESATLLDESGTVSSPASGLKTGVDEVDPWDLWNNLRSLCDSHPNVGLALELTASMGSVGLERWNAEPVRIVLVSTCAFVPNRHGFPVLPRRHQEFIRQMFNYKCYFAVSGRSQKFEGGDGMQPYVQYLGHLFAKRPAATEAEQYESPYYDYLQSPLQPLSDNLESNTYEAFERDPVKYEKYREAVAKYLKTRIDSSEKVIIMVLGAGRGPLVQMCLQASEETGVDVSIYAVEKNPNAVVTLQNLAQTESWSKVQVIATDMRFWEPEEKADLIVSELLGSFGDNELSPECLDGAMRCLKDAEDNARYAKLVFKAKENNSLDGLAGYFDAVLYDDVSISIVPETFSTGMFSWFPLYFPIRVPIQVKRDEEIEVHLWRKCTPTKVWYEWCFVAPQTTAIHNPNGRSYAMSLS